MSVFSICYIQKQKVQGLTIFLTKLHFCHKQSQVWQLKKTDFHGIEPYIYLSKVSTIISVISTGAQF